MSIDYRNIARFVALRANQIVGGDASARNTAYGASLSANMDGTEVPYAALKADILAVEKEIVQMIGNSNNALHRAALAIQSANVASGGNVPTMDPSNIPFVGAFDGIFDATNHKPLREMPQAVVDRRIDNANSFWRVPAYFYCLEGSRIRHTRANVYFRGVGWSYSTQSTLFDAFNGTSLSPLPQELEVFFGCKTLVHLPQENWFIAEAEFYRELVREKQSDIIAGKYELLSLPQIPSKTASVNPVKD